MPATSNGGHSAQVTIQLVIDGDFVPVSQLGPDFLILASPFDHPAGRARLILKVDQAERQWDVYLPNGISASSKQVSINL